MRKLILLTVLLLLADGSSALPESLQSGSDQRATRPNTWTARSSTGLMLGGTWTVKVDPATGAATGTWTLLDGSGRPAANGAWAAAKSATGWTGGWRAAVAGRSGEYSGTWTARVDLTAGAPFAQLFEKALQSAVAGTWRAAGQSGTWTIQAFN
jgi:hypothetical protein